MKLFKLYSGNFNGLKVGQSPLNKFYFDECIGTTPLEQVLFRQVTEPFFKSNVYEII